jgi:hypothetical protein
LIFKAAAKKDATGLPGKTAVPANGSPQKIWLVFRAFGSLYLTVQVILIYLFIK